MSESKKNRTRSTNFSEVEEETLLQCVLLYKDIIENKKTDSQAVNAKNNAWEAVTNEFNARCPSVVVSKHHWKPHLIFRTSSISLLQARTTKALRDKYTNVKTLLRKQFAAEKTSRKKTGGGRGIGESQPKNEAIAELSQVIALSITGTDATYDDDDDGLSGINNEQSNEKVNDSEQPQTAVSLKTLLLNDIPIEMVDDTVLSDGDIVLTVASDEQSTGAFNAINENSDNIGQVASAFASISSSNTEIVRRLPSSKNDWSKYSPGMLRRPANAALKRPASAASSRGESADELDTLQAIKKKMIQREMEMREEEHAMRLSQQKAEHEARMSLLAAQQADLRAASELREIQIEIAKAKLNSTVKSKCSDSDSDHY